MSINLTIPNIEEQKKIGSFFTYLDALIDIQQKKLDKLKQAKLAMLQLMFPQDGESIPKIRFDGFTNPWKKCKLSNVATMHTRIGWQNLRKLEFLDSGDYYLITGTDFLDGEVNLSNCHFVEKERYEQDKNIQISNGSILITKDGTLGKVAYVKGVRQARHLKCWCF